MSLRVNSLFYAVKKILAARGFNSLKKFLIFGGGVQSKSLKGSQISPPLFKSNAREKVRISHDQSINVWDVDSILIQHTAQHCYDLFLLRVFFPRLMIRAAGCGTDTPLCAQRHSLLVQSLKILQRTADGSQAFQR